MKVPDEIIADFENSLDGLRFGHATLHATLSANFHDGNVKYRLTREVSVVPGKPTSGSSEPK